EQPHEIHAEGEAPSPASHEAYGEAPADQPVTTDAAHEAEHHAEGSAPAHEAPADMMQTAPVDAPAPIPEAVPTSEAEGHQPHYVAADAENHDHAAEGEHPVEAASEGEARAPIEDGEDDEDENGAEGEEEEVVESLGGDALEETTERTYRPRRQYKIQEVIKR